jgi:metallo-beta-lactamase class B
VTPKGNILINSDYAEKVSLLKDSIKKLGFKYKDTKILLISHAHLDHAGGSAKIRAETKARYMVMDRDVGVIQSGGKTDFRYGKEPANNYPPAIVDRVLHDGDKVTLGGSTLVAHLTAGHTKGCITWTMQVKEKGKDYHVVIVGSVGVNPGYKLVNNSNYHTIAADYAKSFAVLKALPCDIFLGAHGMYFGLEEKYALRHKGGENPFIDPQGYKKYINLKEHDYHAELAKQKRAILFL